MNKHLQTIHTMLLEDSHRWDCENYCGVVVVHPDMVEVVIDLLREEFMEVCLIKHQKKVVEFENGGTLKVLHIEDEEGLGVQKYMCGQEYTSIMVSGRYRGSCDHRHIPCTTDNIAYMVTRLRSRSEHLSKFVMM